MPVLCARRRLRYLVSGQAASGQGGFPFLFLSRCTGLPVLLAAGWPGPKERCCGASGPAVPVVLASAHAPAGTVLPGAMPVSRVLPGCCVTVYPFVGICKVKNGFFGRKKTGLAAGFCGHS